MIRNSWPATLESVPLIRHQAATYLAEFGVNNKTTTQLCLALEEITVNIVHYAYGGNEGGSIDVALEIEGSRVIIHVMDRGIPFNPTEAREPDIKAPALERSIGGLGLYFVKNLVDEIEYTREDDENHLVIIKSLEEGDADG